MEKPTGFGESAENVGNSSSIEIPEWLNEDVFVNVLKVNFENFEKIVKIEFVPAVNTGENFMTILLRVNIEAEMRNDALKELSYMAKILPRSEQMQSMVKTWRVFEKERNTYKNYIPEFEEMFAEAGKVVKFGPHVLEVENISTAHEVLIMEDLRRRGFKNTNRQNGLDKAHTEAALEKLAQFHAASACHFESKGPYPEMYRKCLCSEEDSFVDYRQNISKIFRDCLVLYNDARYLDEKLKTFATLKPDQFQVESPLSSNEFNVLNHGDCWANNIMFQYNEGGQIKETYFVDYQMSRYGSPAQDLQYMLLSSTCLENKLKHFDYFIYYYHAKLIDSLKTLKYSKPLPSLKDLHISVLRHGDWAYTIITALLPIVVLDPSDNASVDNVLSEDEEGQDLKKAMFTNKRYADHMSQLLPWMDRRGLLEYV